MDIGLKSSDHHLETIEASDANILIIIWLKTIGNIFSYYPHWWKLERDVVLALYVHLSICPIVCFHAISQQILISIQWNFVRTFNTKRRCAYHFHVKLEPFNSDLCIFCKQSKIHFHAISQQPLTGSQSSKL